MNTVRVSGLGGRSYVLTAYRMPVVKWNKVGGIYCFAYPIGLASWRVLYVGQTDNFAARMPCHERWSEAAQLGTTYVLALTIADTNQRDQAESDLIATLRPKMNVQGLSIEALLSELNKRYSR